MGEKEEKEKAEKLAAAKKRVAALQKKKKAAAGGAGEKPSTTTKGKSAATKEDTEDGADAEAQVEIEEKDSTKPSVVSDNTNEGALASAGAEPAVPAPADDDEEAFAAAISAANATSPPPEADTVLSPASTSPAPADQEPSSASKGASPRHMGRQPSVSLQSKIRSTSFRDNGPLSPAALSGNPLSRIEELERENRKLSREAEEHENRWRRVEEELEEVREENASKSAKSDADSEIQRLRAEIENLRRRTSTTTTASRRESSVDDANVVTLKADLDRKDSTIADMQLEISRLRSQLSNQTAGCETHGEQISALQSSLSSLEAKLAKQETELSDTKKALSKASEKAVLDGTERTSKDTKIRTLERELEEAASQRDEVVKKAEQLDKKVEAMNKLHREAESRHATKLAAAEASAREVPALRAKIERAESESARLREKHKRVMSGDGGGEGLDELEDEDRQKLEKRIRELEGEVFDLRRGVWRDKRIALQPRGDEGESRTSLDAAGAAEDFDEVDLTGSGNASSRRRSFANQHSQPRHSNFAQVLNSGLAAFRANTTSPSGTQQTRPRNDSLLEEFDDDDDTFDENAFAHAQREEEARKMVEHVREVKRGLKQWAGWRLDLVDARRAGVGIGFGDIFEV
ncbi:hypothetical protein H2200_010081 [Cladophialophora chaetospira]|uniref:M protein repeat protein n=1 Tax=Cladophialophora chaetospira TaxID=386627 RepID=A0AA38X274_9EURO|nr:hypothetical protein H2200_010081 [Cladophialophora chaetospira]